MDDSKLSSYQKDQLLRFYRKMKLVREFELRAIEERRSGLIPGFIHSCVGQEATAVGACEALTVDDVITSTHRGHGHLLGKGGDPKYMMAELAARSAGYCLGRGGSLHISDFDLGILGVGRIVEKPAARDGELVIRDSLTLSLSFDHRLIDGAPAAQFLHRICESLENPATYIGLDL